MRYNPSELVEDRAEIIENIIKINRALKAGEFQPVNKSAFIGARNFIAYEAAKKKSVFLCQVKFPAIKIILLNCTNDIKMMAVPELIRIKK